MSDFNQFKDFFQPNDKIIKKYRKLKDKINYLCFIQ